MILTWFFKVISGESGINWLSKRFSRYQSDVIDKFNDKYVQNTIHESEFFECRGAGNLEFGTNPHCRCGNAVGFHIGVSWGRYGYGGGVIGRDNAKRLAELILQKISECQETEDEERARYDNMHIENLARLTANEK